MAASSNDIINVYSKKTESAGNGLFASKDIPAGDLILRVNRPLVTVSDSPHLNDTCSNCCIWVPQGQAAAVGNGKEKVTLKACTGCKIVRYCGKTCQSESWNRHHKYECKIFKRLYPKVLPNTARMVMQLLLLKKGSVIPEQDWQAFLNLQSHIDDIKATQTTDSKGQSMWETIDLMSKAAQSYSGSPEPLELIHTLTARLLVNTLTLVTPTYDSLGLCLDPLAALMNHSCSPNAVVVFDGPQLHVRSLAPILKDAEILISYTDITDPAPDRQRQLRERYFFDCACPQCSQDLTLDQPSMPKGLDAAIGEDKTKQLEFEGFSLLARARTTPDPAAQLALLEASLALFTPYVDIWPPYRQPWAHLRQETTVACFNCGKWAKGLAHSLKIYFHIDPVHFAQPFHPVRVVHQWVLVRLVLHLAALSSSGNSELREVDKYGIDWGVVLWGLLRQVAGEVDKSHGAESGFAGMVNERLEEVGGSMRVGGVDEGMVEGGREREWVKLRRVADEVVV